MFTGMISWAQSQTDSVAVSLGAKAKKKKKGSSSILEFNSFMLLGGVEIHCQCYQKHLTWAPLCQVCSVPEVTGNEL